MREALLFGLQDLRLVESPVPKAGHRELIVQVHACGICPTDVRKFRTLDEGNVHLPINLGHEFVGTIVEAGADALGFEPGMRIMGEGYAGYAEFAAIDLDDAPSAHSLGPILIPESVSNADATFAEPVADCLHALLDQAALKSGDSVLIVGGGTMGQLLLLSSVALNCPAILSEPIPDRRSMALLLGSSGVIDPTRETLDEAVRSLNGGQLVDAVILSIGDPHLISAAMRAVRPGGRIVLFGGFPRPSEATIDPNLIHYSEIALVGSEWVGVAPGSNIALFRQALELIANGTMPVAKLISEQYPLSHIHQAFTSAARLDTFKVIVTM